MEYLFMNIRNPTNPKGVQYVEAVLRNTGVFTDDLIDPLAYFRVPSMS